MLLAQVLQQLADAGCEVKFSQHPEMGWGFTVEYSKEEPSGFECVIISQRRIETQELAIDCMIEMCEKRGLLAPQKVKCQGCNNCQCGE